MSKVPRLRLSQSAIEARAYFEKGYGGDLRPADTPYIERQVDAVVRFGGLTLSQRILDLGCGMGRYTLHLAKRGYRVEGLDASPALLARLKEFDAGRFHVPVYCADALDPPSELSGQFDAVVGFFVLHHIRDLAACFRSVAQLLKPGGTGVFLEPNPYNVLYYVQAIVTPGMSLRGERGILNMRPGLLRKIAHAAGLEDFAAARFGLFPPFLTNRPWGAALETWLDRVTPVRVFLAFNLFKIRRPAAATPP